MSELVLRDVLVDRGEGPVISDASFTVPAGSITAVVGPNGAGKTSLLEAISGVIPVKSGTICLDGTDVTKATRRRRTRLGLAHVQQGRAIFPSLSVRENIAIAAHTPQAFDEAVRHFPELEKRMSVSAALLSGGEQQMVVLARALSAQPRFLLIDEMSLGLAPVVFLRLLPVIQHIAESGVGILLVEQFAQHALAIAREAVVISGGDVAYSGPAAALLADPDLLVRAYLG